MTMFMTVMAWLGCACFIILAVNGGFKIADWCRGFSLRRQRVHDDLNEHSAQLRKLENQVMALEISLRSLEQHIPSQTDKTKAD